MLKILIADDSLVYRIILKKILRNIDGVEVCATVSNGKSALKEIFDKKPDIVLLDIEMPVMNGLDMCQLIKQNTDYKHIPVIFMSTISSNEIENRCKEVGGAYFFKKPLDKEELLSKVKELIEISI